MEALDMQATKTALENVSEFIPQADDFLKRFCKQFAARLNPQVVPMGFYMAFELLLHDISTGENGFPSLPFDSSLVGYPPMMYNLLRMRLNEIAEKCIPDKEFSAAVVEFSVQVQSAATL